MLYKNYLDSFEDIFPFWAIMSGKQMKGRCIANMIKMLDMKCKMTSGLLIVAAKLNFIKFQKSQDILLYRKKYALICTLTEIYHSGISRKRKPFRLTLYFPFRLRCTQDYYKKKFIVSNIAFDVVNLPLEVELFSRELMALKEFHSLPCEEH